MGGVTDGRFLSVSDIVLSSFLNIRQNQYCIFLFHEFLNPGTRVYIGARRTGYTYVRMFLVSTVQNERVRCIRSELFSVGSFILTVEVSKLIVDVSVSWTCHLFIVVVQ